MNDTPGSKKKKFFPHRRSWHCVFLTGLITYILLIFFSFTTLPPVFASAISRSSAARSVSINPTQGPAGAVIVVSGSDINQPDGTQIQFGYITNGITCTNAVDSQAGVVHNRAFSGWLRWPVGTGTGFFQVCASVSGSGNFFLVGMYQVLSTTPPQLSISSATLSVGEQATVTGANFLPAGTNVNLFWQTTNGGGGLLLGTVTSDTNGAFSQTFPVPSRASTGLYTVTAVAGSNQPPALSAVTPAFHVDGITIVAVPTPTAQPDPTAPPPLSPTAPATSKGASSAPGTSQPTIANRKNNALVGLLLPIALVGLLFIVAALLVGVLVVQKQRKLAHLRPGSSSSTSLVGGNATPDVAYQANTQLLQGVFAPQYPPGFHARGMMDGAQKRPPVPFDPDLAEAMRQAQVSLFATPRPSVGTKVPT